MREPRTGWVVVVAVAIMIGITAVGTLVYTWLESQRQEYPEP